MENLGEANHPIEQITGKPNASHSASSAYSLGGAGGSGGTGGNGGNAINITYVDNYSMVALMYSFMLTFLEERGDKTNEGFQPLLSILSSMMKEQEQFRKEFISAIEQLPKNNSNGEASSQP